MFDLGYHFLVKRFQNFSGNPKGQIIGKNDFFTIKPSFSNSYIFNNWHPLEYNLGCSIDAQWDFGIFSFLPGVIKWIKMPVLLCFFVLIPALSHRKFGYNVTLFCLSVVLSVCHVLFSKSALTSYKSANWTLWVWFGVSCFFGKKVSKILWRSWESNSWKNKVLDFHFCPGGVI